LGFGLEVVLSDIRIMPTTRICLWSSPRNVSTALMYSFAQRADTCVFDEPLYPHFLRVTGAARPDREVTLATMDTDGNRVVREVILGEVDKPVAFFKLMPHFLVDLDWGFLDQCRHVLLTRDPAEILRSYTQVIAHPTMQDIGMDDMLELCGFLEKKGKLDAVLDAEFVLQNPDGVLRELCRRLEIPFDENMLHWQAGAREEDGPWAKYWYHSVHASTGFRPWKKKNVQLPEHLTALYQACLPSYKVLRNKAIKC
jgi:hypothetical protein